MRISDSVCCEDYIQDCIENNRMVFICTFVVFNKENKYSTQKKFIENGITNIQSLFQLQ